ncbi:hypothetical protein [Shinella sp. M27]|uniref:hypothetical protein n=1 Tax=Shinella sp. M27 TaxID=3368614 RepID=UPI003B9EEB16
MDSANITRMPDGMKSHIPLIDVAEIKTEASIHFPKIYNALAREGMEVATKLLEAGLHVTLFGRPADFASRWRKRWSRLSFVALNDGGSCHPQKLSDGLCDPTDAIILIRDDQWQQDEDGYSDDLEHDVVHSYSERIYERYIVIPQGSTTDAS